MSNSEIEDINIIQLHKKYIYSTSKDFIVKNKRILICNLTFAVQRGCGFYFYKVYLKSRVLKHIYDKRTAQVYDFILSNVVEIIKYPDVIYENHSSKRGGYIFRKLIEDRLYCVVIEENIENDCYEIVTVFPTDDDYLRKFDVIWSWKGGNPHRNTLDAI